LFIFDIAADYFAIFFSLSLIITLRLFSLMLMPLSPADYAFFFFFSFLADFLHCFRHVFFDFLLLRH